MEEVKITSRKDISRANRIVIKAGTSIVSTPLGYPSLPRIANIVEHAADLVRAGKQVIIVTSGAVGVGKQKLRHQDEYGAYTGQVTLNSEGEVDMLGPKSYNAACAAAGQLGLMSLYSTMFDQHDIRTSQLVLTCFDFASPERCQNIQNVVEQLLRLGIVPLLNENDAVSANQGHELFGNTFSDNDSLASLVAGGMNAHLLVLLTDVEGVFDRPPSHPKARIISTYTHKTGFEVGDKSAQGRGGMGAKVDAALKAIDRGVPAVVIAAGGHPETLPRILRGDKWGTLFLGTQEEEVTEDVMVMNGDADLTPEEARLKDVGDQARVIAAGAREGSRALQKADSATRDRILLEIAKKIDENREEILAANKEDLDTAESEGLNKQMLKRLKLTQQKLDALVDGIRSISQQGEPLGKVLSRTCVSDGLILNKISCPVGVLLIIFESRPDCLPQIAACAIRSGNGLVLKGGREAEKSNEILHSIVTRAITEASGGEVPGSLVGLVTSRSDIPPLLKQDDVIDLVIPRGSASLVRYIKDNTRIPVMGHAEGICHVYIDEAANMDTAVSVTVDSKVDYPSACNAAETVLLHRKTLDNGVAATVIKGLKDAGVEVLGGEVAMSLGLTTSRVEDFSSEYGDLVISLEVVDSADDAIRHIHKYGSAHTECIVTENKDLADRFLREVDSACVFHNASTRFSDGYRFGLGAEVGVSTNRTSPRGPVGVEGLLAFKWTLQSDATPGHTVASFSSLQPEETRRKYSFLSMPL
mmetsp:Transcript_13388/g.20133  ORF Transcript_13388/g.20133 Transcript_13388/m.20133 type:complete len:757 (+) Transcript_13388:137-2407(+)|eukprot:CAMPEP_0185020686 /NCGR_PEP_ID=MMETSP1103-20130426/3314_1 /TAXON_ID=36769 /ORGANISM="Paraphysomonas bandaiensis, Strain Caron Lab Isolate" /LENGTH=756 /DNA_ID=CAMNT_0027551733 /DNA_START=79 /DNA_END=2349 /DNA_ORIENTATION=-